MDVVSFSSPEVWVLEQNKTSHELLDLPCITLAGGTFPTWSPLYGHSCILGPWPPALGRQVSSAYSNSAVWSGLQRIHSGPSFLEGCIPFSWAHHVPSQQQWQCTWQLTSSQSCTGLDSFESQLLSTVVLIFTAFCCYFCFLDISFHSSFWIRNKDKN